LLCRFIRFRRTRDSGQPFNSEITLLDPNEIAQMALACKGRPQASGVLSTGEQIALALLFCDTRFMPHGYEKDPLRAWGRLSLDDICSVHAAVTVLLRQD